VTVDALENFPTLATKKSEHPLETVISSNEIVDSAYESKNKSDAIKLKAKKIFNKSQKGASSIGSVTSSQTMEHIFEKVIETDYKWTSYLPHKYLFIINAIIEMILLLLLGIQIIQRFDQLKTKGIVIQEAFQRSDGIS
jgi:hypothetical protein